MGSAEPLEIVFTLTMLVGVGFDGTTVYNCVLDLREAARRFADPRQATNQRTNGAAKIAAEEMLNGGIIRLICLIIGVGVGASAMTLPHVEPVVQPGFQKLVGYGLFLMLELIVLKAILAWGYRRKMNRYLVGHTELRHGDRKENV